MTGDRWVTILIAFAIAGYGACFQLLLPRWRFWPCLAGGLAWTANLTVFALNWIHGGAPPFDGTPDVLVVLAGCLLPLFVLLRKRALPVGLAPHFAAASCVAMVLVLVMGQDLASHRWAAFPVAIAIGGYGACFLRLLPKWRQWPWIVGGAAWMANFVVFVLNWIHAGHPPFGNMYHVLVVLAGCFLPLYVGLRRRAIPAWLAPHFAAASCVPMIGVLFMGRDLHWRRIPALQSPWFVPHVFSYMVSYALLAVAFFVLVSGLASRLRERQGEFLARARQAAYAVSRLAFPLLTFGLLSGALWAEEAWGVYWSWDPKETWSLITWTMYIAYFHARCSRRTRPLEIPFHLLAFAALVTTFVLVNLLPKFGGMHSYS